MHTNIKNVSIAVKIGVEPIPEIGTTSLRLPHPVLPLHHLTSCCLSSCQRNCTFTWNFLTHSPCLFSRIKPLSQTATGGVCLEDPEGSFTQKTKTEFMVLTICSLLFLHYKCIQDCHLHGSNNDHQSVELEIYDSRMQSSLVRR